MKKVIFAVVFASIFFIASLVFADDNYSEDSLAEAWVAINNLKAQVAELQAAVNTEKDQDFSDTVSGNFVKVTKDASQSENYIMRGMMIQ